DPAGALAAEMGRDAVGDRRRAQDAGVAEVDDARALGPFLDAELEADRAELGRDPAVGPDLGAVADHRVVSFAATATAAFSSSLAESQSASSSANDRSRSWTPRSAAWRSTLANRRRNLSFAARRAASASIP